jgi:hypothetical protein
MIEFLTVWVLISAAGTVVDNIATKEECELLAGKAFIHCGRGDSEGNNRCHTSATCYAVKKAIQNNGYSAQ